MDMINNILVVAPHPDDEILGCGATMKKKILQGHNVYVIIMTNAHFGMPDVYPAESISIVRSEALVAHKLLGVKDTIFLDFPAPKLDQFPIAEMTQSISKCIAENNIDTVYLPHRGDIHFDHKRVFDSTMVACRPVGDCPVKRIYAYETLSETEWSYPYQSDSFIPTFFEKIDVEMFNYKCKAMECFTTQLREFPNSRSLECIEALGKYRGATIGAERAEAFMVMRIID